MTTPTAIFNKRIVASLAVVGIMAFGAAPAAGALQNGTANNATMDGKVASQTDAREHGTWDGNRYMMDGYNHGLQGGNYRSMQQGSLTGNLGLNLAVAGSNSYQRSNDDGDNYSRSSTGSADLGLNAGVAASGQSSDSYNRGTSNRDTTGNTQANLGLNTNANGQSTSQSNDSDRDDSQSSSSNGSLTGGLNLGLGGSSSSTSSNQDDGGLLGGNGSSLLGL